MADRPNSAEAAPSDSGEVVTAGAFDVRVIIGGLLGVYGVILTVTGIWFTDDAQKAKADGTNLNLSVGIALILVGLVFIAWARLRPIRIRTD